MARDEIDDHVHRWSRLWEGNPEVAPEIEGALVRMKYIQRRSQRGDVAAFTDPDFTREDYLTLHALMVQPAPVQATPAQLAEAANVTRAAMTARLDRLDRAGLITREVEPLDRRRVIVRPTAAGRAKWEEHIYAGMARDRELLKALSVDELKQLNAMLRKVMLSFEQENQ
ncbi:MarR family transcriptional regulator [Winogradskya consettensis]|uniref:MarR family transcriptional regulator n=1 Tax=Winogradskya consettensis TaxID=113560 RepID=A0A919SXC5_9ACTN|nr:MarR family transcriptional regulator [Actinoplanes consettensis]GIM79739.1 MarR family transcriptional regulator [Actinoplanes consettensis]